MSNKLGGRQGTSYLGTNAASPPNWTFHTDSPTIYNSQNFSLGDMWLNTTLQDAFVLTSLAFNPISNVREAVWFQFANGPQIGTINQFIVADGTIVNPLNGQITFPNAVITANTNPVSNILTSVQPNNGSDFLINLTPQISLRNEVLGVDSITLEQISVSGGAWNSTLRFNRADGTIAAPTAISNNFGLGSIRWFGYTGSGYTGNPSACIKALVKGAVTDNANPALRDVPTCIAFAVSETQLTIPFDLSSLDIALQLDPDGTVIVKKNMLFISRAGMGLKVQGGANSKIGIDTLVLGVKTVPNSSITANSKIFLQRTDVLASTGLGSLTVVNIIPTTSFQVVSRTDAAAVQTLDVSSFSYFIVEEGV